MISLNQPQLALLRFITGYQRAHGGISPTVRECARALGASSKSCMYWLLTQLEERGAIRRLAKRERAIEVLWAPPIPMMGDAPLTTIDGKGSLVPGLGRRLRATSASDGVKLSGAMKITPVTLRR